MGITIATKYVTTKVRILLCTNISNFKENASATSEGTNYKMLQVLTALIGISSPEHCSLHCNIVSHLF